MQSEIPAGCQFGFWHEWGKWALYAEGDMMTNDLASGKSFPTGKVIHQQRRCVLCDAMQLRKVKS